MGENLREVANWITKTTVYLLNCFRRHTGFFSLKNIHTHIYAYINTFLCVCAHKYIFGYYLILLLFLRPKSFMRNRNN